MLISSLLLARCKKGAQLDERAAASQASAAPSAALPVAAAPAVASASAAGAMDDVDAGALKAGSIGDWVDGTLYKFRLDGIKRCADSTHAADAAGASRFAINVSVAAKVDLMFVSPRALSLEQGGVIIQAELEPGSACGAPLPSKQLKADEIAHGVVVLNAPSDEFAKGAKLAFRPTRWGGAPPTLVAIPTCLDACPAQSKPKH